VYVENEHQKLLINLWDIPKQMNGPIKFFANGIFEVFFQIHGKSDESF